MVNFYFAKRWTDAMPGAGPASGSVYMACGLPSHTLERRKLRGPRLFDPQVYLGALQPHLCNGACTNLVSYPWFATPSVVTFDSGQVEQGEWKAAASEKIEELWRPILPNESNKRRVISDVLNFQADLKVEAFLLPAPLTSNPSSDFRDELDWLDTGIDVARHVSPGTLFPVDTYATVALSDTCLSGVAAADNQLLSLIIDQLSTRGLKGVYIVVEQSNEKGYSCVNKNTITSILRLVSELKTGGVPRVITSFCGIAGLVAACVGADAWVGGWKLSQRRLRLQDIEDSEGRAQPAYYSHQLAAEINVAKDLPRIFQAGLLDELVDDTVVSRQLIEAVRAGREVPPEWAPFQLNASQEHFAQCVERETHVISQLSLTDRHEYARSWLTRASQLAAGLRGVRDLNDRTETGHQQNWLDALHAVIPAP